MYGRPKTYNAAIPYNGFAASGGSTPYSGTSVFSSRAFPLGLLYGEAEKIGVLKGKAVPLGPTGSEAEPFVVG